MPTWPKQPKQAVPTVGAGPGHSQRHTQPGWAQRWEGGRREHCGWPASLQSYGRQSYPWPEIPGMTGISGSPKANSPLRLETCVYSQQFLVIPTSNLNRIPNRSWLSMCRSGSLAKIEKASWSWDLWGKWQQSQAQSPKDRSSPFPEQVPLMTSVNQTDPTLRYSSGRGENIYTQRLVGDIYWTFTHNCPKPEMTQMPCGVAEQTTTQQ